MLVKGGNKSSQDGHQLNCQNIISYYQLEMGDIEISLYRLFPDKKLQLSLLLSMYMLACTISSNKQYM